MSRNIHVKHRPAVIGAGLTLFRRRMLETPKELAWIAAKQALDEAGLTLKDIDCVVIGSAPDTFDGVHFKGEYLADGGAGGVGKPTMRVYVGGATGVMVPIAAWWHVASGHCNTVLAVAEEKMSSADMPHPQAVFRYIWDPVTEVPLQPNLIWIFAMEMHRYMYKCGTKKEDIALVSVKNKRNALDHPAAQVAANITVDDVLKSEVLVWPVQLLDISPVSDGAAAIVVTNENTARRQTDTPVWIDGVGWALDTTSWTNRDLAFPEYANVAAQMAYRMAGITNPRREIDVAEVYDPFDYKELHHMEGGLGLAKKCEAPKLTKEGITQRDGDLPINPSGGLLGVGNPIAAAGLMKVSEIYWQLAGKAGKRQIKKPAYTGLAHAWGGDLMQASTVVIMRA